MTVHDEFKAGTEPTMIMISYIHTTETGPSAARKNLQDISLDRVLGSLEDTQQR